jgi:hypothetical protein
MKLRLAFVFVAVLSTALFSGCATVTRGTTEQITVQSEPSGAAVRLSNGFTGITPATFTVPRKGDLMVTVTKEGYETADVALPSQLAGAGTAGFLGNALIGGIIGGGVDIATGATLSHVPNPLKVTLVKKPDTAAPPPAPEPAAAPPATAPAAANQSSNTVTPSA